MAEGPSPKKARRSCHDKKWQEFHELESAPKIQWEGNTPSNKITKHTQLQAGDIMDPDVLNYLRLCRIVLDNIAGVLRDIFRSKISEKCRKEWIDGPKCGKWPEFKTIIENARFQSQKVLLESGKVEDWDVTLLGYTLVQAIELETHKFEHLLSGGQRDAVRDLIDIRNEDFGHISRARIDADRLKDIVEEVRKFYEDLDVSEDRIATMESILKETYTDEEEKHVLLTEFINKMKNMEELSSHVNALNLVQKDIQTHLTRHDEEIARLDETVEEQGETQEELRETQERQGEDIQDGAVRTEGLKFDQKNITAKLDVVPPKKYMKLALNLGLSKRDVEIFEADHNHSNSERVLIDIVDRWMRNVTDPKPSWASLEEALKSL